MEPETEARVDAIVAAMSVAEKSALCTGLDAWSTAPIDRLGLPSLVMADGPHGLRKLPDSNSMAIEALPATCFPTAALLAATWDPALLREVGAAIAEEAVSAGVHVVLGPGINIKRTPLCGRNFEYFSEDPYLTGECGVALVEGMQSRGVGASLKHFAVNNQETRRLTVDAVVDERTLREVYLAAFETVVGRAHPWSVMCCYNRVNGDFGSENRRLLHDILKDEWGFEGLVVSDWGAVHDRVASVSAGLDLEMPGPRPRRTEDVVRAVERRELDEDELDDSVRRIVRVALRAQRAVPDVQVTLDAHHELARRTAAAGIVLLKNDGVLPLRDVRSIAVIGRSAVEPKIQGVGSSHVHASRVDQPLSEIRDRAGEASVSYAPGHPADESVDPLLIEEAVAQARSAEVALLFVAVPDWKEHEGADRTDLDLPPAQVTLIDAVTAAQPRTVVVLGNGSAVAMRDWIDGTPAVLEAWLMGQAGAGAVADVLFGHVVPSGRLAETFPERLADTPAFLSHPGELDEVRYVEGLFVGYRWYDARRLPVLFPFGHGLSYTTFDYGAPRASSSSVRDVDGVVIEVEVTNTGEVTGAEVVQVYVSDTQCSLQRPEKELKGFAKIELAPGETRTVRVQLDFRSFAFYHPGHRRWMTESGPVVIHVGASAADIRGSVIVDLVSTAALPPLLTRRSTLGDWLADPLGRSMVESAIKPALDVLTGTLGTGADAGAPDPAMLDFLGSLPLPDVIAFGGGAIAGDPRRLVDDLVARVHSTYLHLYAEETR